MNDAEHALADFAKAQKLDPRYSRAIAEKVLRLTPDTAEGWFSRGLALIRLKRYAQASEAFGRVLHLQPDHAQAWFEKGFTLLELERYEEALLAFVESLKTSLLLVSNRADVSQ
ncbi:MAG: tetratricopeptide repeat protein [Ktedonobacteraceae bacterium]|nr:tetratricopeptide repeat protein [Ktedonobacteraceae bacterium]